MFPFTFPFGFNMLSICIIVWKDQMTMTIDNNEITSFAPDFGAIMRLARLLSLGHVPQPPTAYLHPSLIEETVLAPIVYFGLFKPLLQ
jgi:hypothetical protein